MVYLSDIMQKKVRWWIAGGVILLLAASAAFTISAQAISLGLRFGGIIKGCFFQTCLLKTPELVFPDCGISCETNQPCHCARWCGCWCKESPPLFPWGQLEIKPASDGAPEKYFCPVVWYLPFGKPFELGQWLLGQSAVRYPKFTGVDSQFGVGDNKDKNRVQEQYKYDTQ